MSQLMLIDKRPAFIIEFGEDGEGAYVIYRHLGETTTHWLSIQSYPVRARAPARWRS